VQAACCGFRPIMMTTWRHVFGALAAGRGKRTGAECGSPLGISSSGGLAAQQVADLYTTPR